MLGTILKPISLYQLTMIECVEKFEEKGPIILPTGEHQVNQVNRWTPSRLTGEQVWTRWTPTQVSIDHLSITSGCRSQTEPEPENPELSYWTMARPIRGEDSQLADMCMLWCLLNGLCHCLCVCVVIVLSLSGVIGRWFDQSEEGIPSWRACWPEVKPEVIEPIFWSNTIVPWKYARFWYICY